jgi:GT2 family glycosyltransferase
MVRPPSSPVTISVVIPVEGGREDFTQCLRRIGDAVPAPDEVIIVADGKQDESWLADAPAGTKVVRLPARGGPGRARNAGVREAAGTVIFFIDSDVTMHADAVGRVRDNFERDPGLAAVFGSYDDSPAHSNFLSQYKNLTHHFVHQQSLETATTFWTGCGAVRRDVFLANGGFDEQQAWIEDIELGYRLTRAGHRIRLDKTLQVTHWKRYNAWSLFQSDVFHRAVPWMQLLMRGERAVNDLNLRSSNRAAVVLAYGLVAALLLSPWIPFAGWLAAIQLVALIVIDADLFKFLIRVRGWWFAIRALPWRIFSWLYSGAGAAIGAATVLLDSSAARRKPPVTGGAPEQP